MLFAHGDQLRIVLTVRKPVFGGFVALQPGLATFGKPSGQFPAVGPDVVQHRVPMGQGGAFARTREDYATLRGLISGLSDRVNEGLKDGEWMNTLGPILHWPKLWLATQWFRVP